MKSLRFFNIFFSLLVLSCLITGQLFAKTKQKHRYDMTERGLVAEVVAALQGRDNSAYARLFPESDSIAMWVMQVTPPSSQVYQEMSYLLSHPVEGMKKDSLYDAKLNRDFDSIINRGEKMSINWRAIVLSRYELVRERKTRDSIYEKIFPVRFRGYFFVRDMFTRRTFAIAIADILKMDDKWYGGQLQSVYMASSMDEYLRKQKIELERIQRGMKPNFGEDTSFIFVDSTEEHSRMRQQVVDRKLFKGTFDNEIPVELYIRYYRGGCPEGICSWDAVFKFGEQNEVVATVSRTADGKWHFTEETGVMDLTLNGDTFTGTWTSESDQTEYEVKITDAPVSNKKLRRLDEILESTYSE